MAPLRSCPAPALNQRIAPSRHLQSLHHCSNGICGGAGACPVAAFAVQAVVPGDADTAARAQRLAMQAAPASPSCIKVPLSTCLSADGASSNCAAVIGCVRAHWRQRRPRTCARSRSPDCHVQDPKPPPRRGSAKETAPAKQPLMPSARPRRPHTPRPATRRPGPCNPRVHACTHARTTRALARHPRSAPTRPSGPSARARPRCAPTPLTWTPPRLHPPAPSGSRPMPAWLPSPGWPRPLSTWNSSPRRCTSRPACWTASSLPHCRAACRGARCRWSRSPASWSPPKSSRWGRALEVGPRVAPPGHRGRGPDGAFLPHPDRCLAHAPSLLLPAAAAAAAVPTPSLFSYPSATPGCAPQPRYARRARRQLLHCR
jgi:hypothetical protein